MSKSDITISAARLSEINTLAASLQKLVSDLNSNENSSQATKVVRKKKEKSPAKSQAQITVFPTEALKQKAIERLADHLHQQYTQAERELQTLMRRAVQV